MTDIEVRKGLTGIVVDYTAISKVVPETNSLTYRGYPVQELARYCTFEEVAYLLWNGELPSPDELRRFSIREKALRRIDRGLIDVVRAMPLSCHPMDVLRSAVSYLAHKTQRHTPKTPTTLDDRRWNSWRSYQPSLL